MPEPWLTPGVRGIGAASLLADVGHEIPTAAAEPADHAAVARLAPDDLRGSAFGLLAGMQSFGNLGASAVAGALWTLVSPAAGLLFAAAPMAVALGCLGTAAANAPRE